MTAGRLMLAEMAEQPAVLAALAARREELVARVRAAIGERPAGVVLLARGSSDNAAVYGRYVLERAAGRPIALAAPSLHTRYEIASDHTGYVVVAVSQSGRTPEIVSVLERMRGAGARTLAIVNEAGSPLADAADAAIELEAGEERAVPATKTYTAQLAAFAIVAEAFGEVPWCPGDWELLPGAARRLLDDREPARRVAEAIADARGLVAIARGYLYSVALEAALKLRETTGLLATGYSAADFLHGPIAAVDAGLPVLALAVAGPAADDVAEAVAQTRERGGQVFTAVDGPAADLPLDPGIPEALAPIVAALRVQQVAAELALRRGIDPDAPFGLRKVTPTT